MEESLAAMNSISEQTEANIDKSNVPEEWETLPNIEILKANTEPTKDMPALTNDGLICIVDKIKLNLLKEG